MTTYERLETIKTTELTLDTAHDTYNKAEAELVGLVGDYAMGAEVRGTTLGFGHIVNFYGTTLDGIIVEIEFADTVKKFSLKHILENQNFVTLVDTFEIGIIWNEAMSIHKELTKQFKELDKLDKQLKEEAAKKAEEERKAEEKYQKARDKALKDFDEQSQVVVPKSTTNNFYYALGWLAKHIGSMTAILPDYLGSAFEKRFGKDTPKTLVDSRAKTSGGYAKQWSWEFKCTIKKLKETTVPAAIKDVTTDFSKGIHNTAFLWNLVDNYGFQFAPKQDVEKIKACIPSEHLEFFEAGFAA